MSSIAVSKGRGFPVKGVAVVVAIALAIAIAVLATRKTANSIVSSNALNGHLAPAVTAKTLNGQTISLSSYRGRVLILNFFASWCIPCQQEHSDLMRFSQLHDQSGDASLVAVVFNDSNDDARKFFQTHGGTWPALIDSGEIAVDYGVTAPPETFVIDQNGFVRQKYVGAVDFNSLEASVTALKAEAAKS